MDFTAATSSAALGVIGGVTRVGRTLLNLNWGSESPKGESGNGCDLEEGHCFYDDMEIGYLIRND